MITEERHFKITQLLRQRGFVELGELAAALGVSPETVRRDLRALEALGQLKRVRGGATLPEDPSPACPPESAAPAAPPEAAAPRETSVPGPSGEGQAWDWFSPARPPFRLCGFPFFQRDGVYRRMPLNPPEPLPPAVDAHSWGPSGGQIRFSATLSRLCLRVKLTRPATASYNIVPLSDVGFDLYASDGDGRYTLCGVTRFYPLQDGYECTLLQLRRPRRLDLIINFPLRSGVESVLIGLDRGCVPMSPPDFSTDSRILIYGGSIMHGFCASRPGMTHANQLSRRLNREVIDLGFNGSAKCERSAALAVRMVEDVGLFIISPEGNCPTVEWLGEHMRNFLRIYREARPDTKIAVMSYMREGRERFDDAYRETRLAKKRCEIEIVREFQARGDRNIEFWDGEEFTAGGEDIFFDGWSAGDECTTDTQHKSDLGFWLMANGIQRRIQAMGV